MIEKKEIYDIIPKDVLFEIMDDFLLELGEDSIHGIFHWGRVIENGLHISKYNNANKKIIITFGFFHDVKRYINGNDPLHGIRGGNYLREFKGLINLTDEELETTAMACEGHTLYIHDNDLNTGTCWDADRLDLGRDNIYPDINRLNNHFKEMPQLIEEGYHRGKEKKLPKWTLEIYNEYKEHRIKNKRIVNG